MQISYTHKFSEATTRKYGGAQRLKQLINAMGTWNGQDSWEAEAPRRRWKLKGALRNPNLPITMEGAKATQGARNGVQNSLSTDPVRLREQSAESSWPKLFSLPVYFLKIYTSALYCFIICTYPKLFYWKNMFLCN